MPSIIFASRHPESRLHKVSGVNEAHTDLVLTATTEEEDFQDLSATTNSFTVVAADASDDHSWITGEDSVVGEWATITIELFDAFQNPVVGVIPQFEASGAGNSYGDCEPTDADGVSTCSMTSTEFGEKELEITEPVVVKGDTIVFLPSCEMDGEPFGGGGGNTDNPWRICSPLHLNAVRNHLGDHFIVLSDIDLFEFNSFQGPIGDSVNPFTGQFDGGGFTISNLSIDQSSPDLGLFGVNEGLLENIILEEITVTGRTRTGGLVGQNNGTIRHSCAHGQVTSTNRGKSPYHCRLLRHQHRRR